MLCDASRYVDRLSSISLDAVTPQERFKDKQTQAPKPCMQSVLRKERQFQSEIEKPNPKPSLITIQSASQIPRSPHQLLVLVLLHLQLALPLHADS